MKSSRLSPAAILVAASLTVAGCGNASRPASTSQTIAGAPLPRPCPTVQSASDLASLGPDSDAVIEGTAPGATGTLYNYTAVTFHVDRIVQARPGVSPAPQIRILLGEPKLGLTMPAGRYLLFVQYNAPNDTYTFTNGDVGEFLLRQSTVVRGCTPTTAAPNAAAATAATSWSSLEQFAATVQLGPR